ncbi:ATP-dependent zinc metalloprotease FtsH [Pelagibius litoralis]|uniref:ATP-dependent zinc metalloprotease FtsH n=1 Tax=Pelagibius litoralis TaxID=374515 RepID=A0A967C9M2_9PROT|nr:ATP-dependent zinc metalloprotease FtsH [Pelagibius litoralis]NIA67018.1 ATP-dependent zinc metalloprotease FtsH [Pelagibius litoralis]
MLKGLAKWLPALLVGLILLGFFANLQQPVPLQERATEIAYSEFKKLLKERRVAEVVMQGQKVTATLRAAAGVEAGSSVVANLPEIQDPNLFSLIDDSQAILVIQPSEEENSNWVFSLLPWLVFLGLYFWFWQKMQSNLVGRFGGRDPSDFLTGSSKKETKAVRRITFDDVAGQEAAKREVGELVDFLKDPERYSRLGAEAPRGVLLMGPPGTGKTLLARALAGEAGVAFYHTSASEFIEMFVGVGASRVRKMFDEAKERAPSIIFIDELDAVGRVRGTGLGGGNDEREQTLNQILSEMDGFSGHEAVIVLAATNRPDVLDPALLRPGRFDRHVTLELPDRKAREAILKVHTRKIPLAEDVDLSLLAASTPGFSGADLKNLVNEAAMAAARADENAIRMGHFDEMRDKVMMGSVRSLAIRPDERHRLAVHEAGHTVTAHFLPLADPIYKVTIIPRGRALGGTHMLPEEERHTLPVDYLKDRLTVLLGGRTAEQELLGEVSSGADDDIQKATQLARAMVSRWGMSEEVGPVDLRQSDEHPFLGREIAQPRRFSETTAHEVDRAVAVLLQEATARATAIIGANRQAMEHLVRRLEERESLSADEIDACLGGPAQNRGSAA